MSRFGYSFTGYDPVIHIRASRREIDISPKHAREVCTAIKGKRLSFAKQFINNVLQKKEAVPFRRYNKQVGHRSNIQGFHSGRFPMKAATEILRTLENLEANSDFKGLNTDKMVIIHAAAHRGRKIAGYTPRAFGRSSPSLNTLVHIEIVGKEA